MEERYGIAAFRSRQQVYAFHQALRQAGIASAIVSTPRSLSVGCGLSVRFELRDARRVRDVYRASSPGNLIGFYEAFYNGRQLRVYPLGMETGYSG